MYPSITVLDICKDWNQAFKFGFTQAQEFINENCE